MIIQGGRSLSRAPFRLLEQFPHLRERVVWIDEQDARRCIEHQRSRLFMEVAVNLEYQWDIEHATHMEYVLICDSA